ncbi:MAG: lytic transglycosylase domain-containing protein [Bacteroidota bacterium]
MHQFTGRVTLLAALMSTMIVLINRIVPKPSEAVESDHLPQVVQAPNINKQFDWAGEIMPYTADARERLDRELVAHSYYHSHMVQYLKLANRYFPMIEQVFLEKGIPDDFKYLAVAESGLRNVVSAASATGLWQFMKPAAKERGLEVNEEVDERYHIEKSTRAAADYLLYLKKRFGTWSDAAAAYNMGPTRFAREMKNQKADSFYEMNVNQETMRYLFRLIALKEIMRSPEQFGFYLQPEEKYLPLNDYYEVLVEKSVEDWAVFAEEHGISYRELKRYNPWLRDDHLTVIKNKYQIKIPRS